ncbi:hypothetical protein BV372_02620 [Nostoc sp. T09]|uniref:hypothetical protein n=1 Tax=Nostoc sp. T09 TaxID=1932621 RepID=UPI000A391B3F|nr:hypothetical protein [Nostoc sp. T09]OUL37309.1 hypothetical protein BV372_02620 [Nostoc sp. T09]
MAVIKISELRPAGSELFQDSESFLNELNEKEALSLVGGAFTVVGVSVSAQTVVSINGNSINANTIGNVNTVG